MPARIFYGWWVVCACFPIGLYVSGITVYGFTAFFEPFVKEFGWSYTQISFAASLRGLEAGIFSPVVGILVDRFGSRKIIQAGTLLCGLGLLVLSFTRSLTMFYCGFLLLAFGATGCMGLVTMTAVADWFQKDSGKAFGVMSSAFGASGLLVPLIVWLIDVSSWRTALVIMGVGMWGLGLPLSFVIRKRSWEGGTHAEEGVQSKVDVRSVKEPGKTEMTVREALRNKVFLQLAMAEGARTMTVTAVVTHIMPYLAQSGMSRSTAGLIAGGIPLVSIIGRFGLGWLADIMSKKDLYAIAFFSMALGLLALCFVDVRWTLPFFLLLFSSGTGGGMVIRVAILREYCGSAAFGRLLGIIMASGAVGGIVGPTLAGWVFDTFGNYQWAWYGFMGIIIMPTIMILRWDVKKATTV
jgi:OFA family oxalate/formate antiporter-like MFS transporter